MTNRVVCAANKHEYTGILILGVRHFDSLMHKQIDLLGFKNHSFIQGFVDKHGKFLTREEAYIVAKEANQIIRKTGNPDEPVLYSEDLY